MTRLYLIRHPHTRPDPAVPASQWELSETGEEQVRVLAQARFWREVASVYTSPQPKTKVVGEAVRAAYGLPVLEVAGLDEAARDRWLEPDAFQAAQRAFYTETDRPPVPDWEAADAARIRFVAALDAIFARHAPSDSLAVVTHASVLTLYLAHLRGEAPSYADWGAIGFAEVIALDRVSLRPLIPFIAAPYDGLP